MSYRGEDPDLLGRDGMTALKVTSFVDDIYRYVRIIEVTIATRDTYKTLLKSWSIYKGCK